ATSQVDYGLTTGYGSTTTLDPALVLAHSVPLGGLSANTTYNYRVRSRDAAGNERVSANSTFKTAVASVDAAPPTVAVTARASGGTAAGTVTVTADAADDVGVIGVQFLLDGANLGTEDTSAPYSVSWDSSTVATGSHTLLARARDAAGHVTTSSPVT